MIHQFFISEPSKDPDYDYKLFHGRVADVSLHDDLLYYIHDSLKWISSYNPAGKMKPQTGLNLVGPTVLKCSGARKLSKVLNAWSSLFRQSPRELRLTGGFGWIEGQSSDTGTYNRLVFDRDEVVADFESLARLCQEVAESDESVFVMHFGL